jgi:hypothetical protein
MKDTFLLLVLNKNYINLIFFIFFIYIFFDILILKIYFKNIILIYLHIKNTLKNNNYHNYQDWGHF